MAKKPGRLIGVTPGVTPGDNASDREQEGELISAEADDVYEHIESLKERFGEGEQGRVQVMRRMPDGTLVNLPSLPALTFDVDVVAAKYGGGRYEFKFYKGREYLGRDSFTIDESVKPVLETVAPVIRHDDGAPSWLAATLDKMGDAIKAMAERPAPTPPTPPDPIAMITALATAAKAMMPQAPAVAAVAEAPTLKDQLALVASIVDVGTKIVGAREEGGGGGGGTGDAYMEMVAKLADPIVDLVRARATQEAVRRQPRNTVTRPHLVPTPATAAAALPNPPQVSPAEVPMTWVAEIQRWVPMIVARAQRGRSAEDTAFFIFDELSDITTKKLAEMAALPDFATRAAQILPAELGEYPEWVTEFLTAIQDYLFGDDEGSGDETPGPVKPDVPEVHDLDAEAQRKLAVLEDAPTGEPVPTH